MNKTIISALLLGALAPGLTGCASIMDGTKQTVGFSSNPSNASVTIDGRSLGKTPLTEELTKRTTIR